MADIITFIKNKRRRALIKRSVKDTFNRALTKAIEQEWNKIIIVGQGKSQGSWQHSPMDDITAAGMLEKTKSRILSDE